MTCRLVVIFKPNSQSPWRGTLSWNCKRIDINTRDNIRKELPHVHWCRYSHVNEPLCLGSVRFLESAVYSIIIIPRFGSEPISSGTLLFRTAPHWSRLSNNVEQNINYPYKLPITEEVACSFWLNLNYCRWSSDSTVWGACLDRSYTGSRVWIPLKSWMFVLFCLCCVVLYR
jgi:hypothetical protein